MKDVSYTSSRVTLDSSPIESIELSGTDLIRDVEKIGQPDVVIDANLPRADGGRQAWLFLGGVFIFEALIWGTHFAFC